MAKNSYTPIRRIMSLLVTFIIAFLSFNVDPAQAAAKVTPAAPEFKLTVSDDESVFTFTISKTQDADGYRIYAKEPGSTKYRTVATIKKNGKKARTYTYSPFNPGKYTFRIKAYHKNGKKKAWSKVSATKTVTVKSDILSRVPVGIRFADDIRTDFKLDPEEPGGSDKNKYTLEYVCDEKKVTVDNFAEFLECLAPVEFETFAAGGKYVGKYAVWSEEEFDEYYTTALHYWRLHLKTNQHQSVAYVMHFEEDETISGSESSDTVK